MAINLKGRSCLSLMDLSSIEIKYLLELARDLKAKKFAGVFNYVLKGKSIVLLFEKSSTRTRCAFEVAALEEGAHVTFLDQQSSHFGEKESIVDSAKVLGRFYDAIEYRGFEQEIVETLAKYSGVPVYNGLTDKDHPTQILADMLTIIEHVNKPLEKVKVAFVGDTRNNMAYAWMSGCAKMGMQFVAYGPKQLHPTADSIQDILAVAAPSGATITISDNPDCLLNADVIYTDVWVSMGEEALIKERVELLKDYRITTKMLQQTHNPDVKFMHCLPSFHNFDTKKAKAALEEGLDIREVDDEVFNSRNSIVFDEAENRVYTIKALMVATL